MHCGCCGRKVKDEEINEWCEDCEPHLGGRLLPPPFRTYYAQFKKPCPFQVESRDLTQPENAELRAKTEKAIKDAIHKN